MDWQTLKKSLLFLLDDKISGNVEDVTVGLFGGEPLLELPLIKQLFHFIENEILHPKKNITFALVTNGLLLTPSILSLLKKHKVLITLSCDGAPDSHNKHRRLLSNTESASLLIPKLKMISQYPEIKVRITYTLSTVSKLAKNVIFLYKQGFRHIGFSNIDGMKIDDNMAHIIEEQLRIVCNFWLEMYQRGDPLWLSPLISFFQHFVDYSYAFHLHMHQCEAGEHEIGIDPLGNIFPCYRFAAIGQFCLGNINNSGINFPVLKDFISKKQLGAEGCLSVNYLETGDIGKPHNAAKILKKIYFKIAKEVYNKMCINEQNNLLRSMEFRAFLMGKSKGLPPSISSLMKGD